MENAGFPNRFRDEESEPLAAAVFLSHEEWFDFWASRGMTAPVIQTLIQFDFMIGFEENTHRVGIPTHLPIVLLVLGFVVC